MQTVKLKKEVLDYRIREAFKILRTNVEFSGSHIQCICVTSCTPREGKSSVSFRLARCFAEGGKRTLLIDADMRKSVMSSRCKKGKVRQGLSNCLVGKSSLDDAVCETDIPELYMIFSGPVPPNPSELLGGKTFPAVLARVREVFEVIIIDTPPLGSVIDAAIVAKVCDGSVLVVESGVISRHFVKKVGEQLEASGSKILGCVLNKVKFSGNGYYGKYYGKYYGQYYGQY